METPRLIDAGYLSEAGGSSNHPNIGSATDELHRLLVAGSPDSDVYLQTDRSELPRGKHEVLILLLHIRITGGKNPIVSTEQRFYIACHETRDLGRRAFRRHIRLYKPRNKETGKFQVEWVLIRGRIVIECP